MVQTPHRFLKAACIVVFSFITWQAALASDILKERRWAEQIKEGLLVGEPVTLKQGELEFLGIYTPSAATKLRGGVLLLHGVGAHPDWSDIISPLRQELPEAGWSTLAIQLPILPNDAEADEYLPLFPAANARITAGIFYLQQQGIQNIVIVGHSMGSAMGAHFLASAAAGAEVVRAFVGIGMNRRPGTVAHTPDAVAKLRIPVFDLYGSQDLDGVLLGAKERRSAAATNPDYQQQEIPGADHFFRGQENTLVKRIGSWLSAHAPGMQLQPASSAN